MQGAQPSIRVEPKGVAVTANVAKGALKLLPMTDLDRVKEKHSAGMEAISVNQSCGLKGTVYVNGPRQIRAEDLGKIAEFVFVPFWWVETSSKAEECNMKRVALKCEGVSIPMLQNDRPLKTWEKLVEFKAAPVKRQLVGAVVMASKAPKK